MTGERLKELLLKYKVSQSEIARQLGMSSQSLNQMLSATDIKSSLLERIGKVLDVPVSRFYGEENIQNTVASGKGSVAVNGNNNDVANVNIDDSVVLQERIKALEAENKAKDLLLDEKERLIQILIQKN